MKIICGTNFSIGSDKVLETAAAMAASRNLPLLLAHVIDTSLYDDASEEFLGHLRGDRQRKLQRSVARLQGMVAIETAVLVGAPASELVRLAEREKAELIILCQAGPIAPTHWATGSVADSVMQTAAVPTLVFRDGHGLSSCFKEHRPLRVLVGYDFSRSAEAALRWAANLRASDESQITVAYIASVRSGFARNRSPLIAGSSSTELMKKHLERDVARVLGPPAVQSVRCVVDADLFRPAARLMELADDHGCELIVLGTSQKRGWSRLASVCRIVVHSSRASVVVVPGAPERAGIYRGVSHITSAFAA